MNCFCGKKLRVDNTVGTCRAHRALSVKRKLYMSAYVSANFNKIKVYKQDWSSKNKQKLNQQSVDRRKNNLSAKIAHNLRVRINKLIKGKSFSATKTLGCSVSEFLIFLESKFLPGMTWDNYGKNGWHIDHIIPLCTFDLTDKKQFIVACNYKNLQPLWAKDNLTKPKRI